MVGDRPWGVVLGALASARCTGQLTLTAEDGKPYCVAFLGGAVIGASSPVVSDSAARVALTSHLVSSSQVPALARAVAADPSRDEVDVLAEQAKLAPAQVEQLRRRLLVQRAARTFSVERGAYVFEKQITVASAPGIEVDVAPVIWLGARMNLSLERLAEELRAMGARFVLRADEADLARLELTADDRRIVHALRIGASLPELEARHRELEPRATQATIYALVATGLCEGVGGRARSVTPPPPMAVAPPPEARTRTSSSVPATRPQARTRTVSSVPLPLPRHGNVAAVRELIGTGIARLALRADHFALLGVPRDASLDTIRSAYVALAAHLHPDRLPDLDLAATRDAHRLFAHINIAYGVLTDPARRAEYLAQLQSGGPLPSRAPTGPILPAAPFTPAAALGLPVAPAAPAAPAAPTAAERARVAAELAQQGLRALRREDLPAAIGLLTRATEVAPHDVDHAASLAWARFCASTDKHGIAPDVRRVLERAIFKSQHPATARFYLGRVERMLGRVREAVHHFREVLELEPNHAEAAAELRLLEPRGAARK